MSKSVLISIQPFWVFLIIACKMGWAIDKEKTIEVRKSFPKDKDWNRNVEIYCSKDKESFGKIPKEYQPLMAKFLGKVIGEFVCDKVNMSLVGYKDGNPCYWDLLDGSCLSKEEIMDYGKWGVLYGWHISDLKIYDKPKELSDFRKPCPYTDGTYCIENKCEYYGDWTGVCHCWVEIPPQSWCYVEELQNG